MLDNKNISKNNLSLMNDIPFDITYAGGFLGLTFYRALSENLEEYINEILIDDNLVFEEAYELDEFHENIAKVANKYLGYFIEPKFLFKNIYGGL